MQKIVLPINTKSLYFNIKNDNLLGHTATVSTPIKQGNSINDELLQIYRIPKQIDYQSRPNLINQLVKNSKSNIKINNVFIFDKICVNGQKIDNKEKCFCIYLKEEVDPSKAQYGRIKMHYPLSLKYEDEDINIDNKYIINLISESLKKYAFVVNSFEYCFDNDTLNIKTTIVGTENIPYSKVFLINKGVGNKYTHIFNEMADSYDMEIVSLKKIYGDNVNPETYNEYYSKHKEKSYKIIREYLEKNNCKDIECIGAMYPYSLYDISYMENGIIKYLQVYFTTTNNKYFNISSAKLHFISDFAENTRIALITSIAENHNIEFYEINDILHFPKVINSMMIKVGN